MKAVGYINGVSVIGEVNETVNGFLCEGHTYEIVMADGDIVEVRAWNDEKGEMDKFYLSIVPDDLISRVEYKNISGEGLYHSYVKDTNDIIAAWCIDEMITNGWSNDDIRKFVSMSLHLLKESEELPNDWKSEILDMLISEGGHSNTVRMLINDCGWML